MSLGDLLSVSMGPADLGVASCLLFMRLLSQVPAAARPISPKSLAPRSAISQEESTTSSAWIPGQSQDLRSWRPSLVSNLC